MGNDLGAARIAVGHATDTAGATGLTVIRAPEGALRGGVAIAGRATGSRELHALSPDHLVDRIDAILLTGGSAYGLDAAAGVMRWMEERDRGFPVGDGVVPIVPAAVIFDLSPLGRFDARPTGEMAHEACDRATSSQIGEGAVGAGTGATVGKVLGRASAMKGGFGCALSSRGDASVAACVVVNALGDIRDGRGRIIAGARADSGGFADSAAIFERDEAVDRFGSLAGQNTTLAVLATNVGLDRAQLGELAHASIAAMKARITPCGTRFDGDIIFAVCPSDAARSASTSALETVRALAMEALATAIERAVRLAVGRNGIPGLADGGGPT